ncbi:hypothetical protein BJ741DRAFT_215932 [Chytriomyces cf. hyalinus JEL632]|nr:hypothetical protein BJ741DRAFT_215932 [Chytriomyces cf. hyalinus JEL632]
MTNNKKHISQSPVIVSVLLALAALALAIAATAYPNLYSFFYSVEPFGTLTEETGLFRSQVCQQGTCVVYAGDLCTMLSDRGDRKLYPECGEMVSIRVIMIVSDVIVFIALAALVHQYKNGLKWMQPVILSVLGLGALLLIAAMSVTIHLKSQPLFTVSKDTSTVNYGVSFYLLVASCVVAVFAFCWTFYIRRKLHI